MNDSSVIDHFMKWISEKRLGFEKWCTTNFFPHGHRKNMSAFLFPFSTLLVNIFHAEHLGRFFKEHPLLFQLIQFSSEWIVLTKWLWDFAYAKGVLASWFEHTTLAQINLCSIKGKWSQNGQQNKHGNFN